MRTCDDLRGGLNTIAGQLGMERIHGPAHQACVALLFACQLLTLRRLALTRC
jgi:hypothetical protein